MAAKKTNTGQAKTTTQRKTTAKATTSTMAKKPTTTRTAGRQMELTEIPPSVGSQIWKLLRTTVFGRILLTGLGFAIVVLINLLVSGNRFERFAIILGIEVIVAALIAWIVYLVRNRDDFFNQSENG